jgi:ligand-binding sensor domain-containing protein
MSQVKIIRRQIRLIVIYFTLLISACNGQEQTQKSRIESSQVIANTQELIIGNTQSKEQISQVVRKIFQDSKGNIWFGTEGGAFRLSNNSLVYIDSIKSESGKRVTIKDIVEDKDGTIWLGHTDGISSINGETVINYYESDGLISNDVWCIEADTYGNIWIGTIEGACKFNGQEFNDFKMPVGKIDSTLGISSEKMVHNITEDSKGSIWLSTNAGLFSYVEGSLIHVSEMAGIETNFVNEIFEDTSGEIWVSTKQGLYKLQGNKSINITGDKIEIGKGIGSIAEDKDGKIWFVSNQHYLYTFDGNELIEFQKSEENKGPVVFQIYKDQDDRLWFVGFGGAFRLENGKFLNITKDGPW